jgi:phenylacetate-CoA ligase
MEIFTKSFYINSPFCVQEMVATGYGFTCKLLREGKVFRRMLSELEESQWYSEQELKALQREKLKIIVAHAYKNVPYYKRLFDKLHLKPFDIKDEDDLRKLPIISKKDVLANPDDFLARNMHKHFLRVVFTSGTTGAPLKLYRDIHSINFDNAILRRQYRWAGLKDTDRKAVLRSTLVVNAKIRKPPFWRHDFSQNYIFLSAYHLSENNVGYYAREISRYRPDVLETVPSIGYLFAKLLDSKNLNLNFKYVFTTSEVLSNDKRDFMHSKFKGRIFDYYGLAERVCTIGMCEKGAYHVNPEYGITEFLPLGDGSGSFEIMGTSLNNFAMPLLRYRTGDIAKVSLNTCPCGRNFESVESIEGRSTDKFFITSDGRRLSLLTGVLSISMNGLIETQFIQEKVGAIIVKAVVDHRYSESDEAKLTTSIRNYIGNDTDINIEKVPSIPRDKSGKFRQFISRI